MPNFARDMLPFVGAAANDVACRALLCASRALFCHACAKGDEVVGSLHPKEKADENRSIVIQNMERVFNMNYSNGLKARITRFRRYHMGVGEAGGFDFDVFVAHGPSLTTLGWNLFHVEHFNSKFHVEHRKGGHHGKGHRHSQSEGRRR